MLDNVNVQLRDIASKRMKPGAWREALIRLMREHRVSERRAAIQLPDRVNRRWSLNFVSDAFTDGCSLVGSGHEGRVALHCAR